MKTLNYSKKKLLMPPGGSPSSSLELEQTYSVKQAAKRDVFRGIILCLLFLAGIGVGYFLFKLGEDGWNRIEFVQLTDVNQDGVPDLIIGRHNGKSAIPRPEIYHTYTNINLGQGAWWIGRIKFWETEAFKKQFDQNMRILLTEKTENIPLNPPKWDVFPHD